MKFEYYTQYISESKLDFKVEFDALGELGWELVQIVNGFAIFKRQVLPTVNKTRQLLTEIEKQEE